jgi:type VI protein secretion system component Hcp
MKPRNAFAVALRRGCTLGFAIACASSTASAEPISAGAPATRALGPAAPRPGSIATQPPSVLHADLVVDGNGFQIGNRFAQFGTTVPINSTSMAPLSPKQQAQNRGQAPCHFTGSFAVKNAGAVQSEAVDVYSWAEQPQGPQVGKIGDMGYGNPALAPGARQTWTFAFDLAPGSYVLHVVIDPKRLNRQYTANLVASCGFGAMPQMRAPNALAPAGSGIGGTSLQTQSAGSVGGAVAHAPSSGIKIATPHSKGQYMLVQGVHGESKDLAHQGWIDLLSVNWGAHMGGGVANARTRAASSNCKRTEVTVTKYSDASDPALQKLEVLGTGVDVTITEAAMTVKLRETQITSVAPAQSPGGADGRMRESVTLVGCS